jgi:23S rRNA pseudouridine1911/1915/1917 synthase
VRLGWAASRRRARELIESGRVTVNGRPLGKGAMVAAGDDVCLSEPPPPVVVRANAHLKIETLYRDQSILVVNKPGLMACHPLKPSEDNTVINAVIAVHPEVARAGDKPLEGGLIHRLDNGTSGALIMARNHDAFAAMRAAIRRGDIARRYLALCAGNVEETVEIATPIAHHPKNRRKMITVASNAGRLSGARPAATLITPLRIFCRFSLVEARPWTGSRHQIRVHLSSITHPLVGDVLYGGPAACELMPGRFWLHLSEVEFKSHSSGHIKIQAPLSPDLEAVLKRIRSNGSLQPKNTSDRGSDA